MSEQQAEQGTLLFVCLSTGALSKNFCFPADSCYPSTISRQAGQFSCKLIPSGLHSKPGTVLLCPHIPAGDSMPRLCPQWRSQSTLSARHSSKRGSIAHKPLLSPLQLRQSVHWLAFGNQPSQGHPGNQPHGMGTAYST